MKCTNCNNELETGVKFCVKCGQKVVAETKPVSEQKTGKKSTLTSVVSVIVFILAIGVSRYLFTTPTNQNTQNGGYSTTELANETVRQVKTSTTFPNKLDAATTWVDITAEGSAIRYHYTLAGIDTSTLSNSYLKNYLTTGVCQNADTKSLLGRGINMEYSYVVEGTSQNYFVTLTKADCQ